MTPSEVNAIGRVTMKADSSLSSSDSVKVDWNSYWDQTNKIITSTTGQLVWNYNQQVVQVKAPSTQGLIGRAGGKGTYNLGDVQVNVNSGTPFCSLLFTPLDGQPLSTSAHILVTALAQDKQMGTVYGSGGTTLTTLGGPPLLLQPVQATVTVGGSPVGIRGRGGHLRRADRRAGARRRQQLHHQRQLHHRLLPDQPRAGRHADHRRPPRLAEPLLHPGQQPLERQPASVERRHRPISYTVSDDAAWLFVTPSGGTSRTAVTSRPYRHLQRRRPHGGHLQRNVTVSDPAPATIRHDPRNADGEAPPAIALSTTSLSPSCVQGSAPAGDSFQVWDSGGGALNYTISNNATG